MEDDNYLQEILDNANEFTEKKFSDVFLIQHNELGFFITSYQLVEIGDIKLSPDKIINYDIQVGNTLLTKLSDKILTGSTHKPSGVFTITGYKDI